MRGGDIDFGAKQGVVRITRRTSGGRGEYEVSEKTPNGTTPLDLVGHHLYFQVGGFTIDLDTNVTTQGSKRRLRRLGDGIQVHLQIAALLMLPPPVRADIALGTGEPVIQTSRYAIEHIHVGDVTFVGTTDAMLRADSLTLRNAMVEAQEMSVPERLGQVERIWANAAEFPERIRDAIQEHEATVRGGGPLGHDLQRVVLRLQSLVSEASSDLGVVYYQQLDVVPALLEALNLEDRIQEPTITVDEVAEDEVEVRARVLKEWKRWSNARGPKSALFRQKVRDAYRSTCAICGVRFSKTQFNAAGVDAAHILPWSDYDLDEVTNGICLCKLHHWAFDEGLIRITHNGGTYFVEIPKGVEEILLREDPDFDIGWLRRYVGQIPDERLPRDRAERPRQQFLEMLNASQESAQPPADQ